MAQTVKNLPAVQETWVPSLDWEGPLEKGMATHSSILAWRIPWTEEPGGLQPVDHKESDTTERLTLSVQLTLYRSEYSHLSSQLLQPPSCLLGIWHPVPVASSKTMVCEYHSLLCTAKMFTTNHVSLFMTHLLIDLLSYVNTFTLEANFRLLCTWKTCLTRHRWKVTLQRQQKQSKGVHFW